MAEVRGAGNGNIPAALQRLDRAVGDLEERLAAPRGSVPDGPAEGREAAADAAAEVARLKALHQAVAGRLDQAIERLRVLVGD